MSTDHQEISTELQATAIQAYADKNDIVVVKTYRDEGKSGLNIQGRPGLQQLIRDVTSDAADYVYVLVYDVSRWGRFQDADEAGYLEYICKRAGITLRYCAEQFENDGSIGSTIVKTVKRAMAGEFSRELSNKVFAAQCHYTTLGFRQGGLAGYGLRRMMLNANREPKSLLQIGEHKSLQTDRVVLVPGPAEEIANIKRMFELFVRDRRNEREIASIMNAHGFKTHVGTPWSRATVHQVLTNEKYIGNNLYNRRSFKLKIKRTTNREEQIIRADGAFPPIVDAGMFSRARDIIQTRSIRYSDHEMLEFLSALLDERGHLSALVIDEHDNMPSSTTYRARFGSLLRAYRLVGYAPARDVRYIETNRFLRTLHPDVVQGLIRNLSDGGATVEIDAQTDLISINGEFTASIVLARCLELQSCRRWKVRFDVGLMPDITIAVRMAPNNQEPLDYYFLPRLDFGAIASVRLADENGLRIDSYRYDTLDAFVALAARSPIRRAA